MKKNYSSKRQSDNLNLKKKKFAYIIRVILVILCFFTVKYISSKNPDFRLKIKEILTCSIDFSSVTSGMENFKNSILNITSN